MSIKYRLVLLARWLILLNFVLKVQAEDNGSRLGEHCRSKLDCTVPHSRCEKGTCTCEPYYARVDNSTCVESTLLGSECIVSEQCTMKVAYSACLDGVCRCTDGHLQFRKHTCLSPAAPGHVCYSNEHCRLWDKESHCEFVIPNLFGRCSCNSFFRHTGDRCIASKVPTYATDVIVPEQDTVVVDSENGSELSQGTVNYFPKPPSNLNPGLEDHYGPPNTIIVTDEVIPSNIPMFTNNNEVFNTQEDSPLMQAVMKVPTAEPSKRLPVSNRKDGEPSEGINTDEMTANLHANDQPIYRVVTQPSVDKKANKKSSDSKEIAGNKSQKTGHQKKSSLKEKQRIRTEAVATFDLGPTSLGMPCVTDSQCRLVDPYSLCLNKRCDCKYSANSTSACSARNRGCLPGTFQCRSTGTCISWYFVCDGRKDCPDGSDEKCTGTGKEGTGERCPMHAFRCGGPGSVCVSRASRCDGTPQCPAGEDERNCRATRRKGCPRHTFRCGSGECLPEFEFCNAIVSCKDGSDEPPHLCNEQSRWRAADFCPLRCGNGRCRSTAVACSGRDGCGDNSDEIACTVCKCPRPQDKP